MKAITLWQPWATLIALGAKTIETRSWHTSHRGPIAIHAAKRVSGGLGDVTELAEYSVERDRAGLLLRGPITHPYRLPLGAVVATAQLVACVPMTSRRWHVHDGGMLSVEQTLIGDTVLSLKLPGVTRRNVTGELPYGHFEPGRWAWILQDIVAVRRPVPARGRQGLWNLDADVATQLEVAA